MSAIDQVEFGVTPEGVQTVVLAIGKRHSRRRLMPTPAALYADFRGF